MEATVLSRLRKIVLALPDVTERLSHGVLCFFVLDKLPLCYLHDDHRGDGRVSIWCSVPRDFQDVMVGTQQARFYKPPTSARGAFSSWLGIYLDLPGENKIDWNEIADIVDEAFRNVAPKRLVA